MYNKNIEIESALQLIELLKKYKIAKTKKEKKFLLKQIDDIDGFANKLLVNFSPDELITKITKAISLDKYRPKNLPIILFAVNKDLNYVNGEFDTFDPELSQMFKNNENPKKIRDKFQTGIQNLCILAEQFSADWIQRFKKHKDLLEAARNSTIDTAQDAYRKLFNALVEDFIKEYGCKIQCDVLRDWNELPDMFKKQEKFINSASVSTGIHIQCLGYVTNSNMSEKEKNKIREEYERNLAKNNIDNYKVSVIYINIEAVRKLYPEPTDFFYHNLANFVHEMHHALDYQNTRQGALGSQIEHIDRTIYVDISENFDDNRASATEHSSQKIAETLMKELKKSRLC